MSNLRMALLLATCFKFGTAYANCKVYVDTGFSEKRVSQLTAALEKHHYEIRQDQKDSASYELRAKTETFSNPDEGVSFFGSFLIGDGKFFFTEIRRFRDAHEVGSDGNGESNFSKGQATKKAIVNFEKSLEDCPDNV